MKRDRTFRGAWVRAGSAALLGAALLVQAPAFAGSYEDYFTAIRNDNGSQVSALLGRGFDPNTLDPKGQPGLVLAMKEQSRKAALALLGQTGVNVDALNPAGESALMMAAIKGDVAGSRLLLEHGARVDQPGWAALHYAATGPSVEVVRLLLDKGAAIDLPSPNGSTPLMLAAQYGSEDSVKLLLQRGANAKLRNQLGLGPADFARMGERMPLAALLQPLQR